MARGRLQHVAAGQWLPEFTRLPRGMQSISETEPSNHASTALIKKEGVRQERDYRSKADSLLPPPRGEPLPKSCG